jgi:hypothetical protein
MRDGSTHRPPTTAQNTRRTPDRREVDEWRSHGRHEDLRVFTEGARALTWSRGLLTALLEELQITDEFDALAGRIATRSTKHYPGLVAIALVLRHSWCPQDLERTAIRLGLIEMIEPSASSTPRTSTRGVRGHRRRPHPRRPLSEPPTR